MKDFQKKVIEKYIESYNRFDVDGMVKNFHRSIVFENITNGQVDLKTNGLADFIDQAEKAKQYFSERKQIVNSWNFQSDKVIIDISFEGIIAMDLPGGVKAGDTLALEGQTEFVFKEGKIISITDHS